MIFDKIKELSKDTAIYGISTMVGRFLTFLLVPFYTHVFSEATFGIYTNFYSFIMIFNIFFIYGMDAAYLKFASIPKIGDEKDNFSTPYLSVFGVGIILSLIIIVFRKVVYAGFDLPFNALNLIYYVIPIMFIDAISTTPFLKLRLERKAKTFAAYKLINIFVNVALNLYLILKLKWGIEAVFVSNLVASLTSFILTFPIVLKKIKFSINLPLLKRLLKFGIPYLPAALASMLVQGIDKPILSHMTDLSTTGIYGANYKLGIFMMLFVNMFQYAWQPFFLQNAEEKNAKELFSKVLTYFTIAASLILVLVSLFIGDIVRINFFGHTIIQRDFWSGLDIVPVILFGYLFNGLYVIFSAGIFIEEKSIYIPFITGLGALVNVVVNVLLIPPMGMMGAALATLFAYLAMALSLYAVTQKFYKIDYELLKLTKIFVAILVTGVIYYYLFYSDQFLFIYKILLLTGFSLYLYLFVFDKKEIDFLRTKIAALKQSRN